MASSLDRTGPDYAELAVTSCFSFLCGGSHPDELVHQAAALGLAAVGIADRNSLAGVVRAHGAAREAGIRLLVGARLVLASGLEILCYPTDRTAYGRLSRLLSLGKRRAAKGACELHLEDLPAAAPGQILIILPPTERSETFAGEVRAVAGLPAHGVYMGLVRRFGRNDMAEIAAAAGLAETLRLRTVALNDVWYHVPARRMLQDVLTAIREGCTIDTAGTRLAANAERHLKEPAEMVRLFAPWPAAIGATIEIAQACRFSLDELKYDYPHEVHEGDPSPQAALERLTWEGAAERYPEGIPDKVRASIAHELRLIGSLDYAAYFLTVYDLVRFARARKILCQGRGSAANSSVCYCLGITSVDPARMDLLFERFISAERREPPDIDVDFEHERREEVIQYIYQKYGRERAGLAATVITYRARSAVRDVGKALGLSLDMVSALSSTIWGFTSSGLDPQYIRNLGLDPEEGRLGLCLEIAYELMGFPRHLSQHTGGFVMTEGPLVELVPVENAAMADRTVVEWDKDDLDELGILKVDVLALGMLSCIARGFDLLALHYGLRLDLASVPAEDPAVYDMLCKADSIGVFQVESRAQMSMLPRLKPRTFYDLVIEVAIVRPGPIQGDMVHPYLRRREGAETVVFPSAELEAVLGKTLGVPLFQEQAMRIAIVAAGFTPEEADKLRRAMATFRKVGIIHTFGMKLVEGMVARGYDRGFAERCFKQIEGFGEYGFPESHAASFALLVYVSSWLKCHYPDVFLAAILNSQPMGFYAPAQLVRDARAHGVEVREVDVNRSAYDATLEPADRRRAVRLGLRQIKGLNEADALRLVEARPARGYSSPVELRDRAGLSPATLERLAKADAFRSMGLDRRAALWAVKGLGPAPLPLFAAAPERVAERGAEPAVTLAAMPLGEHVVHDYANLRLSLKAHPVSFLRDSLAARGFIRADELDRLPADRSYWYAGLVLVRQRPGSAKGVIFATLEDETGVANIIVWPKVFERFRQTVLSARLLGIRGRLQREGLVIHLVAERLLDMSDELSAIAAADAEMPEVLANADEIKRSGEDPRGKATYRRTERQRRIAGILPRSRDFH